MQLIGWLLGGVVLLWAMVTAHTAWRLTHPPRGWRPHDWQPSDLPLRSVAIQADDGVRLRAWVAPHADAPATVICVHGWGTNHTEMEWRAGRLHRAGYSVVLFDFRACGESAGAMCSAGVHEMRDLRAIVDMAATDSSLNGAPIVILANSMGAAVSITVAASDTRIRAIFSDAAYASLESATAWGFKSFTGLPPWPFKRGVTWLVERMAGARMRDLAVIESIASLSPRPVLLAHGTDDPLVSPHDAEALFARAGDPKELWRVPGAGHVVAEFVPPEVYDARVTGLFTRALEEPGLQDHNLERVRQQVGREVELGRRHPPNRAPAQEAAVLQRGDWQGHLAIRRAVVHGDGDARGDLVDDLGGPGAIEREVTSDGNADDVVASGLRNEIGVQDMAEVPEVQEADVANRDR